MPPPLAPRPDAATYATLISTLESDVDAAAAAKPNPGVRTFQRLNRPEYARAVHDLLALDVDAGSWLPLDTKSANFDNIADAQALSPTLLEAYLNAASAISRMAVGDRNAPTVDSTYSSPGYVSQHPWDHVEGAPYGTRGGSVVEHVFPADAEYVFEVDLVSGSNARYEDIDISIDGERVALIEYETGPAGGADGRGAVPMRTEPILVKAGQHLVAAAFVRKVEGPYEDLIRPHDWSFAGGGSGGPGITTLPHVRDLIIKGPYRATGISETPSREKIFSCRPTTAGRRAAVRAADSLAHRQRGLSAPDDGGRTRSPDAALRERGGRRTGRKAGGAGGFEGGVRSALEAILASPYFIFRMEKEPEMAKPGGILSRRRHRSRVAAVLLPVGHAAGSGTAGAREQGRAVGAGDAREADAPHARRSARRRARLALRRAVAAAAGRRQGPSRSEQLPELRRQPRRRDAARDRALLQQPRARGSQRPGSVSRQLHLRERAARAALRLPRRVGRRVPPRRVSGRHAPRPARPGQRAGADLARQPDVAGAARQVGDGSADGHAAAAAAAGRPAARRHRRKRRTARC